jgi:glycosyltransferase involved in cell wall biosynthesis
MMTLLQISTTVNSGSVGRIAEQIGQQIIDQGWNSYIAYSRKCLSSDSKIIKIGNKFDVYFHAINTRLFDNHCLCSINSTKKLLKKIDKIKPDLIQIHNIHGYFLNIRIFYNYLSLLNIPIVWTLHDCWSFTGHCTYFDYIKCDKWITGCFQCPQKNQYPASILLDRSNRNYKIKKKLFNSIENMTIVPVSNWLAEQVKYSFLNKYPIHVIQNGIDTNIFHPIEDTKFLKNKYNIENKIILLGVANIWNNRKGLNDFIILNDIIDHEIFKILLVGLKKNQINNLPKEIIGIERTENVNELAALYSIASIYISCSVEETFGLTIIESMACGTPVIVYDCTALSELVDISTGFIIKKGDINTLYKSILIIKEKKKKYYIDNCRKKVEMFYDKEKRYKDYITLYKKLLMI